MKLNRRTFLGASAGALAGAAGCVPEQISRVTGADAGEIGDASAVMPSTDAAPAPAPHDASAPRPDAGQVDAGRVAQDASAPDAAPVEPDAGICEEYTIMYDTSMQALYLDGTYGPLTGTLRVEDVIAGVALDLEFWHGHGGRSHRFSVLPEHFEALKRGERVYVDTDEVDRHQHTLFIDPTDPNYRAPGATPVEVPLC